MFDEVPSRRITQRRDALKDVLLASLGVAGGVTEAFRKGRLDWETVDWALIFLTGVQTYWKKRHIDPWTPPLDEKEDVPLKIEG